MQRAWIEFGSEALPFRRFAPNAAFCSTMLTAFFLYKAFKEDMSCPVVPVIAYATRLRRTVIDIAAKIVRMSGRVILEVTRATWDQLRFGELWRCAAPLRLGAADRFKIMQPSR